MRATGKHICFLSISLVSGIRNQLMRAYLFCYCASFSSRSPSAVHSRSVGRSVARSHTHISIRFHRLFCVHKWRKSSLPPPAAAAAVVVDVVVSSIVMKASKGDTKTSTQASYYNRYFTLRVYRTVCERRGNQNMYNIFCCFISLCSFVRCVAFNVDFNGISTQIHAYSHIERFCCPYLHTIIRTHRRTESIEPLGKGSPSHRFHLFMYTFVRIHLYNNNNSGSSNSGSGNGNNNTDKNNNTLFSDKDAGLASK